MHVVPLRNADATRLAKTLRGMLGKGGDTGSSGELERRQFVQPEQRWRRSAGSNSTGTSGTPPLPRAACGSSSMSSPMGGGGGGASGYEWRFRRH